MTTTTIIAPVQKSIPKRLSKTIAPAKIVTDILVITYAKIETRDKYILAEDDNLFSRNNTSESKTLNLVDGATALKLEDEVHIEKDYNNINETDNFDNLNYEKIPSGLSLENTSYMEKNNTHQINENKLTAGKFFNSYDPVNNEGESTDIIPTKIFSSTDFDILPIDVSIFILY